MVGALYSLGMVVLNIAMIRIPHKVTTIDSNFWSVLTMNFILALFILFYPLAGFLADVRCGRYRVVIFSIGLLWFSTILLTISIGLRYDYLNYATDVISVVAGLILVVGVSGYRSNIIQFGFDQLLEVPSCYLGMFVHWYLWSDSLVSLLVQVILFCMTVDRFMTSVIQWVRYSTLYQLHFFLSLLLL